MKYSPAAGMGRVISGFMGMGKKYGLEWWILVFGALIVFVGAVRMRTEVLPTTVYLEASIGRLEVALAVALLMTVMAAIALVTIRLFGGWRM